MTLAIIGAGGHAKSIFDIIKKKKTYYYDEKKKFFQIGKKKIQIKGDLNLLVNSKKNITKAFIGIGNNQIRKKIFNILKDEQFKFAILIHPKSYCAYETKIGEGTVVMQGALVNCDTVIGRNCIINTQASIDHDCVINDHTHICPGVTIAGNVKIGKNCWIGIGSKIIENCIIGDNVFVAAGSVITRNIKSNSFVKGIPAKYAKKKLAQF